MISDMTDFDIDFDTNQDRAVYPPVILRPSPHQAGWAKDATCVRTVANGGKNIWSDGNAAERETAARMCLGCPVYIHCLTELLASGATWGVWAGRFVNAVEGNNRTLPGGAPRQ